MAKLSCATANRWERASASRGKTYSATSELAADAIPSVTRLINWNQWRVEVTPQRVHTDCTGRNCSPQFSQNKRASQTEIRIVLGYLPRRAARYCTVEQVCRISHSRRSHTACHPEEHRDERSAFAFALRPFVIRAGVEFACRRTSPGMRYDTIAP